MPTRFRARIFGGFQPSYTVELRDGVIVYTAAEGRPGPNPVTLVAMPEQWRSFRQALNEAGVWRWRPNYINNTKTDATIWELDIAFPDREISSHGYNSFPPGFPRFRGAVIALVRGRKFQ
jgi:hypothetical protein